MLQITTIRLAGISNAAHYLFMDKTAERAKENELICKNCADALNILQKAMSTQSVAPVVKCRFSPNFAN
ncbi:hypothetical protein [Hallerella porci]|uniref:Uncharacterized protein n=1 Tax=Hallerella porci TaxID=1945871 RepID=A0ABX5LQI9_9BACT|nr:hypothetical protein [Hallerella porci]PWK96650.1 hypothetical protein B0H50_11634 [Hallerella porci]